MIRRHAARPPRCRQCGGLSAMVKLIVWTAPRCVSTAFEKALAQAKPAVVCMHEPLSKPFYFGKERRSPRYADEPPAEGADATVEGVLAAIAQAPGCEQEGAHTVVKDMAYYLDGHDFGEVVRRLGPGVVHSFLVRSPRATVPSLYKASLDTALTGWDYFDEREVGLSSLRRMYEAVVAQQDHPAAVLDADELLGEPAAALRAFCGAVGLPFDEALLSWERGPLPGWDAWGGWHDGAIESTGFAARATAKGALERAKSTGLGAGADAEVCAAAERSLADYEALFAKRLRW